MDYEPFILTPTNINQANHQSNMMVVSNEADIAREGQEEAIDWGVLIDYKDPYSGPDSTSKNGNHTVATIMKDDSHLESYLRSIGKSHAMTPVSLSFPSGTVEAMGSTNHSRSTITTNSDDVVSCNSESFRDNDNESIQSFDATDLYEADDWRTAFAPNHHDMNDDNVSYGRRDEDKEQRLQLPVSSTETPVSLIEAIEKLNQCMERSNLSGNALIMQPQEVEKPFTERNHSSCPNLDVYHYANNEINNEPQMYMKSEEGYDSSPSLRKLGTSKPTKGWNKNRILADDSSVDSSVARYKSTRRTPNKASKSKARHMGCSGLISRRVNYKRNLSAGSLSSGGSRSSVRSGGRRLGAATHNSTWKKSNSIRSLIRQKQELLSSRSTTGRRHLTHFGGSGDGGWTSNYNNQTQLSNEQADKILTNALNAVAIDDLDEGRRQRMLLSSRQSLLKNQQFHHSSVF